MKSPSAKILVPLAVELAFALIVGVAIVATDGGRYGLGAEAAIERLVARYRGCESYCGSSREILGQYPERALVLPLDDCHLRSYQLVFKRPKKAAGCLDPFGKRIFYIRNGDRALMQFEGIEGTYELDTRFKIHLPPPWCGARAHLFVYYGGGLGAIMQKCVYYELIYRRGADGKRYQVISGHGPRTETHVWVDPDDSHIHAISRRCVAEDLEGPVTELYEDVVFDGPIDDRLFDLGGEGFERLKQWIAEREKEPTK